MKSESVNSGSLFNFQKMNFPVITHRNIPDFYLILVFFILLNKATTNAYTPDFSLVGYAFETTGGVGAPEVYVTNYNELKVFAENSTPYTIYINGIIENGADGGSIRVKSNKSIIGVGTTAFMNGVGFTINGYNNIIIRNIRFSMIGVTTRTDKPNVYSSTGDEGRPQILTNGGDCIRLTGNCYNVWIDHCEFFSEDPAIQTNIDLYDGLIDITGTSYNVTVSWNYMHDHHKSHLVGSSDTDNFDRRITFHHNYFQNLKSRLPFYRFGKGHVFNNYYFNCSSAINSRMEACLLVEKNYFENVSSKSVFDTGSILPGYAILSDNVFDNSKTPVISSCDSFVLPYVYSHVVTNVTDVKEIVKNYAGVGKILTATEKHVTNDYRLISTTHRIEINCNDVNELKVFNLNGNQILSTQKNFFSIENLANGIYIVYLLDNSGKTSLLRFVK
jgi:pectate lyase